MHRYVWDWYLFEIQLMYIQAMLLQQSGKQHLIVTKIAS